MDILGHSITIQYSCMIKKCQQIDYSSLIVGHFVYFYFFRVYLFKCSYFFLCSISCLFCSVIGTCALKQTATPSSLCMCPLILVGLHYLVSPLVSAMLLSGPQSSYCTLCYCVLPVGLGCTVFSQLSWAVTYSMRLTPTTG